MVRQKEERVMCEANFWITFDDLTRRSNLTRRRARMVRRVLTPPTDEPTPAIGKMSNRAVATETISMMNQPLR